MAVLTRTYDPSEGPVLQLEIVPAGEDCGAMFPLLLDTGADGSSISSDVIEALKLTRLGMRNTFASGGKQTGMPTYLVDLVLPFGDKPLSMKDIVVAEFRYLKPSMRGLIGRDIMCQGNFLMTREHTFTLEL